MSRPFFAARWEERFNSFLDRILRQRGWTERILSFTGYGSADFVRVMARLVLVPPTSRVWEWTEPLLHRRGWRNFFSAPVANGRVRVQVGDADVVATTDRNGYIDLRVPARMEPGWAEVHLSAANGAETREPVVIVDPAETFGLVSDIDDTVISTSLPRPLIAAWNTFVLHESARQAVPGMADMYQELLADHPGAPVFYVSTGAWNTAGTLARFLNQRSFPPGPLMLTDWGPTNTGWFRSGMEHKKTTLRQLTIDLPNIRWVLIGDDGQHDPLIYGEFAAKHPNRVRAIAIRELSPAQSFLAHGTVTGRHDGNQAHSRSHVVFAPDGHTLLPLLTLVVD